MKSKKIVPFLLLLPSFLLMGGVFALGMMTFLKFSFYTFNGGSIVRRFSVDTYRKFWTDPYYWDVILDTLRLGGKVTLFSLLLSYPLAYIIYRCRKKGLKLFLIFVAFIPLLVSVTIRSYGWLIILAKEGLVNYALTTLGIIQEPLKLAYSETGVTIALVHIFLPFQVLPILNALSKVDGTYKLVSNDLGAGKIRTFFQVIFPMTLRGIGSGVQLVFLLCITAYATPVLIGGGKVNTIPGFIYQQTMNINWPLASVASITLILISVTFVLLLNLFIESRMLRRVFGGN